jgi:pimeloyl-ACP methyl ester carboxylesterase
MVRSRSTLTRRRGAPARISANISYADLQGGSMLSVQDMYVDGVKCAVHEGGPRDSAEAVVFVHGNPGSMDDWEALAPAVAQFTRVIAMDLPGYGRADRPRGFDYTINGYGRYLGGLIDQLGVRRAHLVLHDFGGGFGLRWAADHPDTLASVTLINTGILVGYKSHKYAKIWQTPLLGELFQLIANETMLRAALNRDNPRPFPPGFVKRIASFADWGHKRAVLALYRASRNPDATFMPFADKRRALDVPTCVIWGERDPYLPVKYAECQKDFFPRAEVHVLKELGHWPFVDDPEAVKKPLLAFLRAHVGAAQAVQPARPR